MNPSALVVDEHRVVAEGLAAIIQSFGWTAEIASRQDQLSAALRSNQYDVIVLDEKAVPNQERIVADACAHGASNLVLMSAEWNQESARRAIEHGACAYVTKTMSSKQLERALGAALVGQRMWARPVVRRSPLAERLTSRQLQIMRLLARGRGPKQVASDLGLSVRTIESHKYTVMQVCGASNFLIAVALLREQCLVD